MSLPLLMEAAHVDQGKVKALQKLYDSLDALAVSDLDKIDQLREEIQDLLLDLYQTFDKAGQNMDSVTQLIQDMLKGKLGASKGTLLAVRSSSTLEDLEKMAGAGLYDSVLNVQLDDAENLRNAVLSVWLSLFN